MTLLSISNDVETVDKFGTTRRQTIQILCNQNQHWWWITWRVFGVDARWSASSLAAHTDHLSRTVQSVHHLQSQFILSLITIAFNRFNYRAVTTKVRRLLEWALFNLNQSWSKPLRWLQFCRSTWLLIYFRPNLLYNLSYYLYNKLIVISINPNQVRADILNKIRWSRLRVSSLIRVVMFVCQPLTTSTYSLCVNWC